MIPFVIVDNPRQHEAIKRLVDYCRELDGTRIRVIKSPAEIDNLVYRNNAAFHHAAYIMQREKAWGWIEPDAIPRVAGWNLALAKEYHVGGKPFMLSSDENPPYDLIGGIGIYPGSAYHLVPGDIQSGGFDGWLLNHLPHAIHRTPLIQHSYGIYDGKTDSGGVPIAVLHEFPRDKIILRKDAMIFHKDEKQSLIDCMYYYP